MSLPHHAIRCVGDEDEDEDEDDDDDEDAGVDDGGELG